MGDSKEIDVLSGAAARTGSLRNIKIKKIG